MSDQQTQTEASTPAANGCHPRPPGSAVFTITAKGPGLHRQFKGTAEVKDGVASASLLLFTMLNQIITKDMLRGDTSITAKLVMKPNTWPHRCEASGDGTC